jgi:hypothetical protein
VAPDPYRTLTEAHAKRRRREPLPDADIVIALILLSPAFLAVVVWTLVRGETFGVGPTVCGALVVLTVLTAASAWRARGRGD